VPLADQQALALCQEAEQQRLGGNAEAAQQLVQGALALQPDLAEAHAIQGLLCKSAGALPEAMAAFERALQLRPALIPARYNLGLCWRGQGNDAAARQCYEQVLALEPSHGLALSCLAQLDHEAGQLDAALSRFAQAAQQRPADPVLLNNWAMALQEAGELERALATYRQALQLRPGYADAHSNLAGALLEQGDLKAGMASFRRAIQLDPLHASAHNNLAMALLEAGQFEEGWRLYDWRFRCNPNLLEPLPGPRWHGGVPEAAELVLVEEQGLGDTLQFIRYAPLLKDHFSRVSFCGGEKLAGLLRRSGLVNAIYTHAALADRTDYQWIPLLSAPGVLGVHREEPGATDPYLAVDPALVALWRSRLRRPGQLLVGLNWQGNPSHERTNSRGRSMALECLAPLADLPHVRFVGLQKGVGSEQLGACSFRHAFVEAQGEVDQAWDFEHTAAIVAATDVMISTDTSAAHLAAALGHPTWILLKQFPEWRWGRSGEATPWYPTARLFRQQQSGNWKAVVQRVQAALCQLQSAG